MSESLVVFFAGLVRQDSFISLFCPRLSSLLSFLQLGKSAQKLVADGLSHAGKKETERVIHFFVFHKHLLQSFFAHRHPSGDRQDQSPASLQFTRPNTGVWPGPTSFHLGLLSRCDFCPKTDTTYFHSFTVRTPRTREKHGVFAGPPDNTITTAT